MNGGFVFFPLVAILFYFWNNFMDLRHLLIDCLRVKRSKLFWDIMWGRVTVLLLIMTIARVIKMILNLINFSRSFLCIKIGSLHDDRIWIEASLLVLSLDYFLNSRLWLLFITHNKIIICYIKQKGDNIVHCLVLSSLWPSFQVGFHKTIT